MTETPRQPGAAQPASTKRRGLELEYVLLLLLITLVYMTRIASPPVRGEESRRATATIYFLETGNYIVPQQQGNVFYMSARPPAQNWLMLPFYAVFHSMGAATIRLPSILAVFVTSSLIYFYGRCRMSRAGAATAALAFATMLQVMELGRTGETDLILTMFVTAGLFGWHYFHELNKRPAAAWMLGYAAIALATLTKGPQAPVYFFATTFVYLRWTGRLRAFFDVRHVLGLCVYGVIVSAWLLPYYLMTSKAAVIHIFTGDVGVDADQTFGRIAGHLISFPVILFGCLLPWSVLLLLYLRRSIRAKCVQFAQPLGFAAIAFCVSLPTVWLVPGSKTRFLLNMFPCAAICIGIALESALAVVESETGRPAAARGDLRRFAILMAGLAFLAALATGGTCAYSFFTKTDVPFAMNLPGAIGFGIVSAVLGMLILRNCRNISRETYPTALFCTAAFFGLLYNFPIVDNMNRRSQRNDIAFHELYERGSIPDHRTLVSIEECPHLINYLHFLELDTTIPKVTLATIQEMRKTNDVYFVSTSAKFPLPYTVIAKLPLRRYRYETGSVTAVVGKIPREITH